MKLYQILLAFFIATILISSIESMTRKERKQRKKQRRRNRDSRRRNRNRDCGPIPHVPFGLDLHESGAPGEVRYACEPGFVLEGTDVITCVDGIWGVSPRCIQQRCSVPPSVPYATYTQNPSANPPSTTYTCSSGYEITSGSRTIFCNTDARTWGSPPVCSAIIIPTCGAPPKISHAYSTVSADGLVATYVCNTGYVRKSGTPSSLTCSLYFWPSAQGTTYPECEPDEPEPPTYCSKPDCGDSTIDPASTGDQTEIGGTVVYTCRSGMRIIGSNDNSVMTFTSTCRDDGTWTPAPSCESKVCPQLTAGTGTLNPSITQYTVGGVATYLCVAGFTTNSPATLSRNCLSDGTWSGPDPICTQVFCPSTAIPTVSNAAPLNANIELAVGDSMVIFCNTNYVIYPNIGAQTSVQSISVTCSADGTYSAPVGQCVYINPASCKEFSARRDALGTSLTLNALVQATIDVDGAGSEPSYTVNCVRRAAEVCSSVASSLSSSVDYGTGAAAPCAGAIPTLYTPSTPAGIVSCTAFSTVSYSLSNANVESLISGTAGACKQTVTWTCPSKADDLTLAMTQRATSGTDPLILYSPADSDLLIGNGSPGYCDCALNAAPCLRGCVCSDFGAGTNFDTITIPLSSVRPQYVTGATFLVSSAASISTQLVVGPIECCDPLP